MPADRPAARPAGPVAGQQGQEAGRRRASIAAGSAPVLVAAATMLVLGLWRLARDSSMGNDEVATRWAALLSLRQLDHLLRNVDAVHGLYYLLMHGWMAVGTSPAVIRIPSVIAMTAAVAMTVIIARRLTGSGRAGLFAGLIMALTPFISYYAQTARSYALVLACVLAATLVLLRAMSAEAAGAPGARLARRWLSYAALVTLAGYLNELSLLVLAAHAVTVLLARPGRPAIARWAAAGAGAAILVAPLADISHREDGAVSWIPRPGLAAVSTLLHDYFGASTAAALLLGACAVLAVLPARHRPGRDGITLPSLAVPLLVVPAALLILESLVARPLYVDRYVLYGEAGAALLAGAGLDRAGRWLSEGTGRRALVWGPGVAVCAAALLLQLGPQQRVRTPGSRLFDFGGPARYVGARRQPGDGVLFIGDFFRKAELGYPADFRGISDLALAVPPARAGTFQGSDEPPRITRSRILARRRIWTVGRSPGGLLPAGPVRAETMILQHRFSRIAARSFRGIVVTLWIRR